MMTKQWQSLLLEGERVDDLQRDGLMIIQNPSWFCFGMDAVLLSSFARTKEGDRCLDLGCGNGVIPILLQAKGNGDRYIGLEMQKDVAEMAMRSVQGNHLGDRVEIVTGTVEEALTLFPAASFDVITSNPPYMTGAHGLTNANPHKWKARHETVCDLENWIMTTAKLLKPSGHYYMVHRPFRLAEIMEIMVRHRLEPKRMRLVYPYIDKEPNMVLIEGVRGGNSRLQVEPPLIVYEKDGQYSDELKEMYYGMER